jgi:lipopolysaccharide export system protein LptA
MTSMPRSRLASMRASGALLLLGLLVLAPASAKQSDRDMPMNIEHADSFNGFYAPNTVTTLRGHILITQGTMKITGDLAKIHVGADQQVNRIVITGTPAHIQQLDDNGNLMLGEAATLDYDNTKSIAVLTGHALVKQQGRGEAHGDKLTYNTQTSEMTGESNGTGGVHMIFQPKPRAASGTASPAPGTSAPTPAASAPAPAASAGQH